MLSLVATRSWARRRAMTAILNPSHTALMATATDVRRLGRRLPLFYNDVYHVDMPPNHRFPMEKYRLVREVGLDQQQSCSVGSYEYVSSMPSRFAG